MANHKASVPLARHGQPDRGKLSIVLPGEDERLPLSRTFDTLVSSNLELTVAVKSLVRAIYVLLGVGTVGVLSLGCMVGVALAAR